MYGSERSGCRGFSCSYKHFDLDARYTLTTLNGNKEERYSGEHNHNDYITFFNSITTGRPPYIEFSLKTSTGNISHVALVRKDSGKWAFYPDNLEEGTPNFQVKMIELRSHLAQIYQETRNPDVLKTIQNLKSGDFAGLLASGVKISGELLAEKNTNGSANYENQIRNLLAGSNQAPLALDDPLVRAYLEKTINALYGSGTRSAEQSLAFFQRLQAIYLPALAPEEIGTLNRFKDIKVPRKVPRSEYPFNRGNHLHFHLK
jgi:hypothetical protein